MLQELVKNTEKMRLPSCGVLPGSKSGEKQLWVAEEKGNKGMLI